MKRCIVLLLVLTCVLFAGCNKEEAKASKNYESNYAVLRVPQSNITVYVTDYGEKYHRGTCGYLYSSKNAINLTEAVLQGYTPCSRCKPKKLEY